MTIDPRILPEAFCTYYEALYVKSVIDGGVDGGGDGRAGSHPLNGTRAEVGIADGKVPRGGVRHSSGHVDTVAAGSSGPKMKQVGKTSKFLRDEAAWNARIKIDKRLRQMAREIRDILDGKSEKVAGRRICTGRCKRLTENSWNFCANCGGATREMDSSDD